MNANQRTITVGSGRTNSDTIEDIADNIARQQHEQADKRNAGTQE